MATSSTAEQLNISIIIPCHNCGSYLEAAVASALSQQGGFTIREIIVVDDRSTDATTREVLENLRIRPRLRVLENAGPRGAAATRNIGIRAACTDWIAFLDADDILPEGSLAVRVEALSRHPDARWVGGNWKAIDAEGALIPCSEWTPVQGRGVDDPPVGEEYDFVAEAFETGESIRLYRPVEVFLQRSISLTSTHLVQRALLEEVGLYDEDLLTYEDRDLYIRLARVADFIWVPTVVFYYRQHGTNTTGSDGRMLDGALRLMCKLLVAPEFGPYRKLIRERLHHIAMMNAYHFRREASFVASLRANLWAIRAKPFSLQAWKSLVAVAMGR